MRTMFLLTIETTIGEETSSSDAMVRDALTPEAINATKTAIFVNFIVTGPIFNMLLVISK